MKLPRHALLSAAMSALVLGAMPTAHAGSISLMFDGAGLGVLGAVSRRQKKKPAPLVAALA